MPSHPLVHSDPRASSPTSSTIPLAAYFCWTRLLVDRYQDLVEIPAPQDPGGCHHFTPNNESTFENENYHSPEPLELELIQIHTTQKPLPWVEVGAHAMRKRSECGGIVWVSAGVAWRLCVCCLCSLSGCPASSAYFVRCSPAGGSVQSTADF